MSRSLGVYAVLERVFGRALLMRAGRFLYMGARRELLNEPGSNGEYKLIEWVISADAPNGFMHFADVGANLGLWSEYVLASCKGTVPNCNAKLIAFEPAQEQRKALKQRLGAFQKHAEIIVSDKAVAARPGVMRFEITGATSGNNSLVPEGSEGSNTVVEVPVTSLDVEFGGDRDIQFDLVKVDTEGNDFNVILGASGLLSRDRIAVLQFEYNWRWIRFRHSLQSVFEFIADKNYVLGMLSGNGIEVHAVWHPELDRYFETNYVLLRKDMISRLPCRMMSFSAANAIVAG